MSVVVVVLGGQWGESGGLSVCIERGITTQNLRNPFWIECVHFNFINIYFKFFHRIVPVNMEAEK